MKKTNDRYDFYHCMACGRELIRINYDDMVRPNLACRHCPIDIPEGETRHSIAIYCGNCLPYIRISY